MTYGKQISIWENRLSKCPVVELLGVDDNHCQKHLGEPATYDTLSCDDHRYPQHLAQIRGLGFHDVLARKTPYIILPEYMPMLSKGSHHLFQEVDVSFVGITLDQLISRKLLRLPSDIRKTFGIPQKTKIMLFNYAHDAVLESIWPVRQKIFKQIAALHFDLVTAVDFSIWHNQPHMERLYNIKRSLITFEDLQVLGIPCIPHVYWFGSRDLERWAEWINKNKYVHTIAINLQTVKDKNLWEQAISEIKNFTPLLQRKIRFVVTGPSTSTRIAQLSIVPLFNITNGVPAQRAWARSLVDQNGKYHSVNNITVSNIFAKNMAYQIELMKKSSNNMTSGSVI